MSNDNSILREQKNSPQSSINDIKARLIENPDNRQDLANIAILLLRDHRTAEARQFAERLTVLAPGDIGASRLLFDILLHEERPREALAVLENLPEEARNKPEVLAIEAEICGQLGDHDREIALLRALLLRKYHERDLVLSLAIAYRNSGQRDSAVRLLEQEVREHPENSKAWWLLSDVKDYRFDEAQAAALEESLDRQSTMAPNGHLHFAIAKHHADNGRPAEAFTHFSAGNDVLTRQQGVQRVESEQEVLVSAAAFAPLIKQKAEYSGQRGPIFVVGLSRSGSTLIEHILSSHSQVEGLGELLILPQIGREILADRSLSGTTIPERLNSANASQISTYADSYLERAAVFQRSDKSIIVDKLPANWRRSGMILTLFPNAVIIDARRHPMAVGFSNFTQNFALGPYFTRNLEAFGTHYRSYLAFMEKMQNLAPTRVKTVINERLVANPDVEIAAMLEFIGIPLEKECLSYWDTKRTIRTPSAEQVRKPTNRDGFDRWREYAPWLNEMKASLGDAIERWDR